MEWRRVWLFVRKGKKRTTYCLRWYDDLGRVRTEAVGGDKKPAEAARKRREYELNSGKFRRTKRVTLSAFAKEHQGLIEGRLAAATLVMHRQVLDCLLTHCGDIPLERITPRVIEGHLAARVRRLRPATVNKELRVLKSIFTRAVRRGYLTDNPCRSVSSVREPEREIRVLSVEEIRRVLAVCDDDRLHLFVFLALTTGLRRGELCALEWSDLDLMADILTVRNKASHTTKTGRIRHVALVPNAADMLRRWRLRGSGSFVFAPINGEDVANSMTKMFKRLVKRAGIAYCTLHDLRRTFVSHLAMAGINEAVVQRLAGHASMKTTERYYINILPEALKAATARLPYAGAAPIVSKSYRAAVS